MGAVIRASNVDGEIFVCFDEGYTPDDMLGQEPLYGIGTNRGKDKQLFLQKFDSQGDMKWNKRLRINTTVVANGAFSYYARDIIFRPEDNNNFYIVGDGYSASSGAHEHDSRYVFIIYFRSFEETIEWSYMLGRSNAYPSAVQVPHVNYNTVANKIRLHDDRNHIYFCGWSDIWKTPMDPGTPVITARAGWIAKMDIVASKLVAEVSFQMSPGGVEVDTIFNGFELTLHGEMWCFGTYFDNTANRGFMVKYSPDLEVLDVKSFKRSGLAATDHDYITDIMKHYREDYIYGVGWGTTGATIQAFWFGFDDALAPIFSQTLHSTQRADAYMKAVKAEVDPLASNLMYVLMESDSHSLNPLVPTANINDPVVDLATGLGGLGGVIEMQFTSNTFIGIVRADTGRIVALRLWRGRGTYNPLGASTVNGATGNAKDYFHARVIPNSVHIGSNGFVHYLVSTNAFQPYEF